MTVLRLPIPWVLHLMVLPWTLPLHYHEYAVVAKINLYLIPICFPALYCPPPLSLLLLLFTVMVVFLPYMYIYILLFPFPDSGWDDSPPYPWDLDSRVRVQVKNRFS